MKSVIQEASSIEKAIDQAWEKAGKPADFSIKILEHPQRNFFGLTSHPAKVSLCFEERIQGQQRREPNRNSRYQQGKRDYASISPSQEQQPRRAHTQQPRQQEPRNTQAQQEQRRDVREERSEESRNTQRPQAHWEQPMISFAQDWLTNVLKEMNCGDVTFTVEPSNAFLRFTLSRHLVDNIEKEKRMLAGMSLLMLEAIKRNFKAGLRRHRIVLTHNN